MLCQTCYQALCAVEYVDKDFAPDLAVIFGKELPEHKCYHPNCVCTCEKPEHTLLNVGQRLVAIHNNKEED